MPDQDYAVLAVLLGALLLIAVLIPAPARAPRHEAGMHLALLGAGSALAILAGGLALVQLPVHSAFCGALAWLTVMPCVWMARRPRPIEGYGTEEDEDDNGGEPWPHWPGAPPSPDGRRPELAPSGLAGARVAWARPVAHPSTAAQLPQHAVGSHPMPQSAPSAAIVALAPASAPLAPSGSGAPTTQAPAAAGEPATTTQRRRLKSRPRGERADHRSIIHKRAAEPHIGRRRRASLRRRVLRRCRMWLWVEPPECVTFAELEDEQLRRRPGDDRRREARFTPLG